MKRSGLFKIVFILAGLLGISTIAIAKDCIGVIPAGSGHAFWNAVEAGAQQAGKELGIAIYYRGPNDESNTEGQRLIINRVVEQGCKGLVLAPNVPERAEDVAALKAKGIPTVYIDRDTGGADVLSVIATNNYEAGKLAGREMVKRLQGKGTVALLRLRKGVASTEAREQGFLEEVTQAGLRIVLDDYLGTQVGEARLTAAQLLQDRIETLDGVFTPNESTTLGTLRALQKLKKAGQVTHIGFDSSELLIKALASGQVFGLVVQQPFEMGYQGVYTVHHKSVQDPSDHLDIEVVFAKKTNMTDPKIHQLLHMDDSPAD